MIKKVQRQKGLLAILIGCSLLLGSCVNNTHTLPPVSNASLEQSAYNSNYKVQPEDTIYSIAWEFGLDYKTLARANHLSPPAYTIHPGQQLKMTIVPKGQAAVPVVSSPRPDIVHHLWLWPVPGPIIQGFMPGLTGNNGVDIAAAFNCPVKAAQSGEIVYSGSGIHGYGNLIIIKHNQHYLSAYAFNHSILVKLGQHIQIGQKIATVGRNEAGTTLLHFEIRQDGRPIDPRLFIKR